VQDIKITLTGHKGFIGSHYYKYLSDLHYQIDAYDKKNGNHQDLLSKKVCDEIPESNIVVHLAATNGTRLFYEKPTEVAFNNTLPTFHLVNRFKDTNTKFVFASTCEIFNGAIDKGLYEIPTDEKVPIHFDDTTNPRWSYSLPKALGENLVSTSGLNWLVLRYFNVYGPKQVDHFISEFVERALAGEYYIKGNDTRSFCYIDDAVEITHRLVMSESNKIVNVGNDQEYLISDVAQIILEILGIDPTKLEIEPGPKGSVTRRCPDIRLMKRLTKFNDFTPLRVGLEKTIESMK